VTSQERSAQGAGAARSEKEPRPVPVRAIAAGYTAVGGAVVWFAGTQWTTATQVTLAFLAVAGGGCLIAALLVRQTSAIRTIALRADRRQAETTQQLSTLMATMLDTAKVETLSELASLQERLALEHGASQTEQASLHEDVTGGFGSIVKSLGTLGRQMRQLDARLVLAEAGIKADEAGSAETARAIEESLDSLARAQTQLSIRSEAVFSEVRRQMSPARPGESRSPQ